MEKLCSKLNLHAKKAGYLIVLIALAVFFISFSGIALAETPGIPGDVTGNEIVDLEDLVQVALRYGQTATVENSVSDLNGDGVIDLYDLVIIGKNWSTESGTTASVPDESKSSMTADKLTAQADGTERITFTLTLADSDGSPITGLADNRHETGADWFTAYTTYPTAYLSSEERSPASEGDNYWAYTTNYTETSTPGTYTFQLYHSVAEKVITIIGVTIDGENYSLTALNKTVTFVADITGVEPVADIYVPVGTELADVNLPSHVNVTADHASGAIVPLTVDWSSVSYNGNTAGTYPLAGTFTDIDFVNNPNNLTATVNVIVSDVPVAMPDESKSSMTADKLTAQADGTERITFTLTLADSDGNPITGLADNRYEEGSDWFTASTSYPTAYLSSEERSPASEGDNYWAYTTNYTETSTPGTYTFQLYHSVAEKVITIIRVTIDGENYSLTALNKTVTFVADITGVEAVADIYVPVGTELADVNLPSQVNVTADHASGVLVPLAVDWASVSYNGNTAGTYPLAGTFTDIDFVNNPNNLTATVNVIVSDVPVAMPDESNSSMTADKLTAKADGTERITFTLTLADSDGNPITGLADNRYEEGSDWFSASTSYPTAYLSSDERRPNPDQPSDNYYATTSNYTETETPGTYTFQLYHSVAEQVTVKIKVTIDGVNYSLTALNKTVEFETDITGVEAVADIYVPVGTELADVNLPSYVNVTADHASGVLVPLAVDWSSEGYDGNTGGSYTLTGTFRDLDFVNNPNNLTTTINVIVSDEPIAEPAVPDAERSSITADKLIAKADGKEKITFTLTLADSDGNPITGLAWLSGADHFFVANVSYPTSYLSWDERRPDDKPWNFAYSTNYTETEKPGTYTFQLYHSVAEVVTVNIVITDGESFYQYDISETVTFETDITGVEAVADIYVPVGTELADVNLPSYVNVTADHASGVHIPLAVDWSSVGYDGNTAGTYPLTGAFTDIDFVNNPNNLTATIHVVVSDNPLVMWAGTSPHGNSVQVMFSKTMADPAGKHEQFTIRVDDEPVTISQARLNTDPVRIDLNLEEVITYGQTVTVAYTTGDVVAADGKALETFAGRSVINNVPDPDEPPIVYWAYTNLDGKSIQLRFNKEMADPSGKQDQFAVMVDGTARVITEASLNSVDSTRIVLRLSEAITFGENVTVTYTAGDVAAVDAMALETFAGYSVINNTPDPDGPPVVFGAYTSSDGSLIQIKFSKEMADPDGKHDQFAVTVDGIEKPVTAAVLSSEPTRVSLMLSELIKFGENVTVSYTAGDVVAADGKALETFPSRSVINNVPDPDEPPVVFGAYSNSYGTLVQVEFSREMADPVGKHEQFVVKVDGVARSITEAALNYDKNRIDLILSEPIAFGQAVTVAFTAGDVAAADGKTLESFADRSVRNNTVEKFLYAYVIDDGDPVTVELVVEFFEDNSILWVPLPFAEESLNVPIDFDQETAKITFTKDSQTLEINMSEEYAQFTNDRIFVDFAYVAEAFGFELTGWDLTTKVVNLGTAASSSD